MISRPKPLNKQEVFELIFVKRIEIHRLMLTLNRKDKEWVLAKMKEQKINPNETAEGLQMPGVNNQNEVH